MVENSLNFWTITPLVSSNKILGSGIIYTNKMNYMDIIPPKK